MPDPVAGIQVLIEDDDNSVRVDPVTGTVERDQPDGGVVVQLDAHRPKADGDENAFDRNLADDIDPMELARIAGDLHEAIEADDKSRQGSLTIAARGLDLLGIELKEPKTTAGDSSGAVEGMSSVTNPLLLEAVLKGWANAQAELLPAAGPVKIEVTGDETAQEDELADAYERDWNYWFTATASEFYPDTSHMLLWGVYFKGSGFKKVYRCPMRRRPVSESIDAKDLIVSDTTKDLRSCGRVTHQIEMRPSVMKRMKLVGAYRDVTLTQPTPQTSEVTEKIAGIQGTTAHVDRQEDQPFNLWETQCELDLPDYAPGKFKNEGIPLPYLVTMDKDSREILALRRNWREDDPECERKRMYVRYPYVPGPGFYGTGMIGILGNASAAMTAAWREALDAGMFASFPGGLIAKSSARQNSSLFRVSPGEFAQVETNNQPIGNVVMGMPYRDVTPGLMAMMDKITGQAKEVGGTADIPAGEGLQNVPVGTMLANIEQATKIMAAAHKGMHTALSEEIELVTELMRENPEDFWRSNKLAKKDFWTAERFMQALNDYRLQPVSDPNVPSHIHRIAKALGLVALFGIPQFAARLDPDVALKRILAAMREDPVGLQVPAQPMPQASAGPTTDPQVGAAKMLDAVTKAKDQQVKAAQGQQKMELDAQRLQQEREVATLNLSKELVIHQADQAKLEREAAREHAQGLADGGLAQQQHHLDVARHGLDVSQAMHEQRMDHATHALDVHQALNPPEPKAEGKKD